MIYDIRKAHGNMKAGLISGQEFKKAAGKRVMTGVGNVAGGAFGQILIPIPVVGGVVGSMVGGLAGSLLGNIALD